TGANGSDGIDGPGYLATSLTSNAITLGSKTFVTQPGLAYLANDRVRISNSATNYIEGVVTAYAGITLTMTVDRFVGGGTFAVWNIGIAGDVGVTGPAGAQGIIGATGIGGAQGNTGPAGPQGLVGATGDTGAQGTAGADGANG